MCQENDNDEIVPMAKASSNIKVYQLDPVPSSPTKHLIFYFLFRLGTLNCAEIICVRSFLLAKVLAVILGRLKQLSPESQEVCCGGAWSRSRHVQKGKSVSCWYHVQVPRTNAHLTAKRGS